MKNASAALAQHIAGEVTTLATLWKVMRRDGQIFGFTDHDRDIAYDDGSGDGLVTYLARSGYTRTAIESTADLAVDNLDVETFFDAAGITEEDLRAGRWDHAEVRLMLVNWADAGEAHLALLRGFLGEAVLEQTVQLYNVPDTDIDGGNLAADLSAWQAHNYADDQGQVIAEFLDIDGALLGTMATTLQHVGTAGWAEVTASRAVPPGARQVRVKLRAVLVAGSVPNVAFDALALITGSRREEELVGRTRS